MKIKALEWKDVEGSNRNIYYGKYAATPSLSNGFHVSFEQGRYWTNLITDLIGFEMKIWPCNIVKKFTIAG